MSRRWVVVSEDSFNELCRKMKNLSLSDKAPSTNEQESVAGDQTTGENYDNGKHHQVSPKAPPVANSEDKLDEPMDDEQPGEIEHSIEKKSVDVGDKNDDGERTVEALVPEHKWLNQLPPSYRQSGLQLLRKLADTGEFKVSDEGIISVQGRPIENYNITNFLRTTCIPFHKGDIPQPIQEWLRQHKEIKFRNHLAKVRPAWVNKYGLRSTR